MRSGPRSKPPDLCRARGLTHPPGVLPPQSGFTGSLDVERVSGVFREALNSFMGKRKSPLTTQMFSDLFSRFPVSAVHAHGPEPEATPLTRPLRSSPGPVRKPVGRGCAAHPIRGQSPPAGREVVS